MEDRAEVEVNLTAVLKEQPGEGYPSPRLSSTCSPDAATHSL